MLHAMYRLHLPPNQCMCSNTWYARLAVKMNVVGVRSLIDFCHTLKGLKSFIHISTAYSNTNQYVRCVISVVIIMMGIGIV